MTRVLVVFLDGVGIGVDDIGINPFRNARLDTFAGLLDGTDALFAVQPHQTQRAVLMPLDAALGVPGLPQSGTGQTALFTGINAPFEFGRHFGPWVPTALRDRLARENILSRAAAVGRSIAFANAYPEELFTEQGDRRTRDRSKGPVADPLRAGPPIVAMGAGVLNRHTAHLARGDAVASEITNEGWRKHLKRTELPIITAAEAGRNLGRIAAQHDLTLFAHYSTDYVGHRGHMWEAVAALERIDEFLAGIIASVSDDTLIAVVSDHGNIEDIRVGHTKNPALGMFFGKDHARFARDTLTLADVAPAILDSIGVVDAVA